MSQQDYTVIMQTISGNLTEGTPPPAKRPVVSGKTEKPATKQDQQRLLPESSKTKIQAEGGGLVMGGTSESVDHQRIVFQFKMDDIDTRLYFGETGLEVWI